MGRFLNIDMDINSKISITFSLLYVEIDLSCGLPYKILIKWNDDKPYLQLVDYDNITFQCQSYQHIAPASILSIIPNSHFDSWCMEMGKGIARIQRTQKNLYSSIKNQATSKKYLDQAPSSTPSLSPTDALQLTLEPKHLS